MLFDRILVVILGCVIVAISERVIEARSDCVIVATFLALYCDSSDFRLCYGGDI